MPRAYALGLDYGTNSVRALVVDTQTGAEVGTGVFEYPSGQAGILLDASDPNLARQNPQDYVDGLEGSVRAALEDAAGTEGFAPDRVVGIGVDTTGSTPIPVDAEGRPLGLDPRFRDELAAQVWLWKDHTGHAEAAEITAAAKERHPEYLATCGGTYSSEWFWSKILRCARVAPEVFEAAHTWVEHADWMPAVLTGTEHPDRLTRGICAAGHKAMFHERWGGYPDADFLASLDPRLARVRQSLPDSTRTAAEAVGGLTEEWSARLGLPAGIPVATGAFDAHLGAVGSGIAPGTLVKIIGTSTCDLMVAPLDDDFSEAPGLCGVVPESVVPGQYGLEAGQSAVGDIFNWFVGTIRPEGETHGSLTDKAERLAPGASGLLALDWHNGNRTVLVDQRLTGLVLGLTLHTTPAELYRAFVEATAFGARVIMERYEEVGSAVERIVNCGGISAKNEMVMQIYADVMGRPVYLSRSAQTCALGAAMAGAVVAGAEAGGHDSFPDAVDAMTGVQDRVFEPDADRAAVYDRLFSHYRRLHDAFGVAGQSDDLADVMKDLLDLRDAVRSEASGDRESESVDAAAHEA
ncbi:ribulokinase [Rubrivirga marina]|uniref:Ribulokinase n=1 Tax=Rubrivirga marina TaxID=1196024 RepID=A0A271IV71_9BACT|nr:ribulokinase [Rubrivirga marina]PAP75010.1 ribulokinase [Rubrivirga marina]